ncbi:MAG: serine/threonine protein kinase [Oleiphilus sp.]
MSDTVVIPGGRDNDADFGKYQFVSELGEGAMGKVFKCFDPDFHRMVAIKTVHKDLLNDVASAEFRERFRNEMRAVGKLTHPNIVSVFDAGEKDGCPYFVMEYVDGEELKHLLDEKVPFGVKQSIGIIKGVLRGLSSVHSNGITHRDLKPANIFISNQDGNAKIADFGIAKLDNSDMTQIGTIIGSPKYMAPEQCVGEPVDARADLFAIGIIFYELLTGEYCFQGETTSAITQKILNVDPEPASKLNQDVPRYIDKVLKKALSKRAGDRFQTALEFLEAIDSGKNSAEKKPKGVKMGVFALAGIIAFSSVALVMMDRSDQSATVPADISSPDSGSPLDNASKAEEPQQNNHQTNSLPSAAPKNASVKSLSPEKSAKIAKLFKVADTYKRIGRLVAPAGSNAFDAYNIILSIDPSNVDALKGISEIESKLIENAKESLEDGDPEKTRAILAMGQELFPDSRQFDEIRLMLE